MKQKDKARKLVTQITNSLTAKLEIGGRMASLYLLGNPDHYTSHKFLPVYWKNYVREVLNAWTQKDKDSMEVDSEKVVLINQMGKFIGLSNVQDYIYRPVCYEDVNLYEWMQCAKRVKIDVQNKHDEYLSDDELDVIEETNTTSQETHVKVKGSILENLHIEFDEMNIGDGNNLIENESDSYDSDSTESEDHESKLFLKDHPLCQTHCIEFNEKNKNIVPNFVGGSLPRCDRGDRGYYCTTMLTLFKPWRSGKDLKGELESWDEAFTTYEFTNRELKIIDNFNLRYECLDARDDFSTQLKGDISDIACPKFMTSD